MMQIIIWAIISIQNKLERDFHTVLFTYQLHMIAWTIDKKLSSINMMSDASLVTSVPIMPIENPTCTVLKAGPSFMPSLVMPIISPLSLSISTSNCLLSGKDQARTCNHSTIAFMISRESMQKWKPSIMIPPGV